MCDLTSLFYEQCRQLLVLRLKNGLNAKKIRSNICKDVVNCNSIYEWARPKPSDTVATELLNRNYGTSPCSLTISI